MCDYLSFIIMRDTDEIKVGNPFSHSATAEELGLLPDTYVEGEWLDDDNGDSLTVRTTPDRDGEKNSNWYKAIVLAKYPTRRNMESLLPQKVLTPAEEPDSYCRVICLKRIPADKIDHVLTPAEEPDSYCREVCLERISADKIDHVLTPAEEPDSYCREVCLKRISADKIRA